MHLTHKTTFDTFWNMLERHEVPRAVWYLQNSNGFCRTHHRHGHAALTRPPADGCERKRNVARTHVITLRPQTPSETEPLLHIREKHMSHVRETLQGLMIIGFHHVMDNMTGLGLTGSLKNKLLSFLSETCSNMFNNFVVLMLFRKLSCFVVTSTHFCSCEILHSPIPNPKPWTCLRTPQNMKSFLNRFPK